MSHLPNLAPGVDRNAGVGPKKDREDNAYPEIDQAGQNEFQFYYWKCWVNGFGDLVCKWV